MGEISKYLFPIEDVAYIIEKGYHEGKVVPVYHEVGKAPPFFVSDTTFIDKIIVHDVNLAEVILKDKIITKSSEEDKDADVVEVDRGKYYVVEILNFGKIKYASDDELSISLFPD